MTAFIQWLRQWHGRLRLDWLTKQWGLKSIALVLAIGLWYYAIGEEGIQITQRVPLEIRLQNPQMSILESSVRTVRVTLIAPRGQLGSVTSERLKAMHVIGPDVKSAGEYTFRVSARDIRVANPYVRIVKIVPEVVQVKLDELIIKKLEIKPAFLGEPAFGYRVREKDLQLNPNAILIEGPKAQLQKLDFVRTKPVDLVGRIRSFHRAVEVDLLPNVKPLSESLIDVFIPIGEEFGDKVFADIPVKILNASGELKKIKLEPPAVSLKLKGSSRILEKLKPGELIVYVDGSTLEDGTAAVQLILPDGVTLDGTAPAVQVDVEKI